MDRCEIRDSSYDVLGRPTWIRKSKKHLDFLWILWGRDRQPVNPFKWAPVRKSILQSEQNFKNFNRQNSKNFYSFSFCTQLMGPLFSVLHLNQGSTDRQITGPNWSQIFQFSLVLVRSETIFMHYKSKYTVLKMYSRVEIYGFWLKIYGHRRKMCGPEREIYGPKYLRSKPGFGLVRYF